MNRSLFRPFMHLFIHLHQASWQRWPIGIEKHTKYWTTDTIQEYAKFKDRCPIFNIESKILQIRAIFGRTFFAMRTNVSEDLLHWICSYAWLHPEGCFTACFACVLATFIDPYEFEVVHLSADTHRLFRVLASASRQSSLQQNAAQRTLICAVLVCMLSRGCIYKKILGQT